MSQSTFSMALLTFFVGLLLTYGFFSRHYSDERRFAKDLVQVHKELAREKMRLALAEDNLLDYQQRVATLIPEAVQKAARGPREFPLRSLASVIGLHKDSALGGDLTRVRFEQAKRTFRDRDFVQSASLFRSLITEQPEGLDVIEAHFLLAESLYQLGHLQDVVGVVNDMVDLFPESELTGFILLRLGQIYEKEDRSDDATEIYQVVIDNYSNAELQKQARETLARVQL